MERVEVLFLRNERPKLVQYLQEQGLLHLEEVPLAVENAPGFLHRVHLQAEERKDAQELEGIAQSFREMRPLLTTSPSEDAVHAAGPVIAKLSPAEQHARIEAWRDNLRQLSRRRLELEDQIEVLESYGHVLDSVSPLLAEKKAVLGENARAMILEGYTEESIAALEKRIRAEVSEDCQFLRQPLGRNRDVLVVVHPSEQHEALGTLLHEEGISPVDAPDAEVRGGSVAETLRKIRARVETLKGEREAAVAALEQYSASEGPALLALDQIISDRMAQFEAVDKFAQSELIGVIHGWVPAAQYELLEEALRRTFGARVTLARLPISEVEPRRVPTLLNNHRIFQPFQLILKMFDPPVYGSFDPTWLVAVSFILFYGFILGDAGYGLFIIGVTTWAKHKWGRNPLIADAMTIAQWMGVSAIIFGLIYAEFFGDLPTHFFGIHPIFHRFHDPVVLLGIAVAFGVIHVPLALILGTYQAYKHGHRRHGDERLGMLLGLTGVGVGVWTITGLFPLGAGLGWVAVVLLFVAALFYLIRGMGGMAPMGLMEVLGLSSNILSYARLMALGLASVVVADLANKIVYGSSGWMLIFVAIPVVALLHLINIGIGVFSPTIHSLRLNYVEFLPKFYEPEGRNYAPFRKEVAW